MSAQIPDFPTMKPTASNMAGAESTGVPQCNTLTNPPIAQNSTASSRDASPTSYHSKFDTVQHLHIPRDTSEAKPRDSFQPAPMKTGAHMAKALAILTNHDHGIFQGEEENVDFEATHSLGPNHQDILRSLVANLNATTNSVIQRRYNRSFSTDGKKNYELVLRTIKQGGLLHVVDRNPARAKDNDPAALGYSSGSFSDEQEKPRPAVPLACTSYSVLLYWIMSHGGRGPGDLRDNGQERLLQIKNPVWDNR